MRIHIRWRTSKHGRWHSFSLRLGKKWGQFEVSVRNDTEETDRLVVCGSKRR